MTKRISTLILSSITASAMLVSTAFAQPVPSGTALETTPSELRATAADKMEAVATETAKEKVVEAGKTATEQKTTEDTKTKKDTDVKKYSKKHKGKKGKKKAAAETKTAPETK
jgi:hypothetical protein